MHLRVLGCCRDVFLENKGVSGMSMVYVIGAAKGGTAKTVTTYNLAYSLAELGKRVLCVDLDPQGNLTTCFGVDDLSGIELTIGELMVSELEDDEPMECAGCIWERNGVDFIPASMRLSAVESQLRVEMGAERILDSVLSRIKDNYDFVLIDTSPAMGSLVVNALAAADSVIVTANPQLLAMKGLQEFLKTVSKIRKRINEKLSVEGILPTMCERRTNLYRTISEEVRETFKGTIKVFESVIPNTVKVLPYQRNWQRKRKGWRQQKRIWKQPRRK